VRGVGGGGRRGGGGGGGGAAARDGERDRGVHRACRLNAALNVLGGWNSG
jgi:hypothetical protein